MGAFMDGRIWITSVQFGAARHVELHQDLGPSLKGASQQPHELLHGMAFFGICIGSRIGHELGIAGEDRVHDPESAAARSARPVSVISTATSTMSGTLASVAP